MHLLRDSTDLGLVVLLMDRRAKKFLKAYLGWGICQAADGISTSMHQSNGNRLRSYTVRATSLGH